MVRYNIFQSGFGKNVAISGVFSRELTLTDPNQRSLNTVQGVENQAVQTVLSTGVPDASDFDVPGVEHRLRANRLALWLRETARFS